MDKICKNCKWWIDRFYCIGEADIYIPSKDGMRWCSIMNNQDSDYEGVLEKDVAHSYEAIETSPDFGCIHFKERE
jgi:hypothetical protein